MQHDHHMKKLAILYFEGKATDEEELRLLEFIKESAGNKAAFAEWDVMPGRRTGSDGGQKTPGLTQASHGAVSAREAYMTHVGSYLPA